MREFDLIHMLCRDLPTHPGVVAGPGDDCAVLDLGLPDQRLLFKTDAVVEGIHFTSDAAPRRIGHKALARPLSDIAAMGGRAHSALVTLALPNGFDPERIRGVYSGLAELARRHGVAVVGGETTTNPERLLISVALLGTVARGLEVLRSGARPGDTIFVTGDLGGSSAGRHLDFEPRLDEARWLVDNFRPHAMIDLSDGMAGDLRHVLDASGCGAELLAAAIPISRAARLQARVAAGGKPPLVAALSDGEDFELLFTIAAARAVPLLDSWKRAFPALRLSCVGKITKQPGVRLRDKTGLKPLNLDGYVHFA
jgi:thiamine-monophosphate kinase